MFFFAHRFVLGFTFDYCLNITLRIKNLPIANTWNFAPLIFFDTDFCGIVVNEIIKFLAGN